MEKVRMLLAFDLDDPPVHGHSAAHTASTVLSLLDLMV